MDHGALSFSRLGRKKGSVKEVGGDLEEDVEGTSSSPQKAKGLFGGLLGKGSKGEKQQQQRTTTLMAVDGPPLARHQKQKA